MDADIRPERKFTGIAASPGIAHGQVFLLSEREIKVPEYSIFERDFESEEGRLDTAIVETRRQIQAVQEQIRGSIGEEEARIFDAHLMVLEDAALLEESIRDMKRDCVNIESTVWKVGQRYIEAFARIDDEYLRERASDIRDVMRRLLANLTGQQMQQLGQLVKDRVLVAKDVSPSDSASMDEAGMLGIVTDGGSKTSHAVIMARSMGIPAVVGLGEISDEAHLDSVVLVDGYEGVVIVDPSESTLFKYGKRKDEKLSIQKRIIEFAKEASRTRDDRNVDLLANIEKPEEAQRAMEMGADGIGLFRTEYLFINANRLPGEEEQYAAYRRVAETMAGRPVTIRTLDLGGDKIFDPGEKSMYRESNPFLGYRAIRFCLDHSDLFLAQLRAVLRASAHGKVRLMYPMISGSLELSRANQLLERAKRELKEQGAAFDQGMEVGSMIEIPSAAIAADTLLSGSDFFSIGTNDLIQYLLAVDRLNDRVAHLYEPTHPAVLRTLKRIVEVAASGDIPVSLCGEAAGDPILVPLLVGLGIQGLSMSPSLLPNVKFVVQNMDMKEAGEIAREALESIHSMETLDRLIAFYTGLLDELY